MVLVSGLLPFFAPAFGLANEPTEVPGQDGFFNPQTWVSEWRTQGTPEAGEGQAWSVASKALKGH